MADEKETVNAKVESKYTKAQVIKSDVFSAFRDVFNVVLDEGKEYTKKELEKLKKDFLNRPVVEQVNE